MRFKRESTAGTPGPRTFYAVESAIPETVCLHIIDEAAEDHVGAHFSLADLDAIIAGLTDLRDAVRAKQGAASDTPVVAEQTAQPPADHIATAAAALRQLAIECVRDGEHDRAVRMLQFLDELEENKTP